MCPCNGTGVISAVGRLIRLCLACRPTSGVRVADPVTAYDGYDRQTDRSWHALPECEDVVPVLRRKRHKMVRVMIGR